MPRKPNPQLGWGTKFDAGERQMVRESWTKASMNAYEYSKRLRFESSAVDYNLLNINLQKKQRKSKEGFA